MTKFKEDYLHEAWKRSSEHREEVLSSDICGCFFCKKTFSPKEVYEWIDETNELGMTAMCPKCGIDSVIGSKSGYPVTDPDFLKQLNKLYFG